MAVVGLSSQSYRAGAEVKRYGEYEVRVYVGGSLLTVTPPSCVQPGPGGARGPCQGFSAASRRRLMRKLAMLQRDQVAAGLFITLTYPAAYPTPAGAKGHLRAFLKRLRRRWPEAAVIWKLEPQKRGAPHFHLLVLGVARLDKGWLSLAWYEVVGSGDLRHLHAGTQVQAVRSYGGALAYTSKYLAKVQAMEPDAAAAWGRWWGVEGDLAAYAALAVPIDLARPQMARLARVLDQVRLGQARARVQQGRARVTALKRAKRRRSWVSRSATWLIDSRVVTGRLDGVIGKEGIDVYVRVYVQQVADAASLN